MPSRTKGLSRYASTHTTHKSRFDLSTKKGRHNEPIERITMMKKCIVADTANNTPSSSSRRQQRRSRSGSRSKKSCHRSVRGVPNLSKETQLLRNRLDKVVECFQETIDSHSQTQTTRLELLQSENKQFQQHIRQLEIENFKYFSELEDSDELMVTMEEHRLASRKEVSVLKGKCESLSKEVATLKNYDAQQQDNRNKNNMDIVNTNVMMMMQKEELIIENTSLKKELNEKDNTIHELEEQLTLLKTSNMLRNKENTVLGGAVMAANGKKECTTTSSSPIVTEKSNKVDTKRPSVLRKKKDETIVLQLLTNHTK